MDDPKLYYTRTIQECQCNYTRMSLWSNALNGLDEDTDLS